jgi:hypothetical protein
MGQAFGFKKKRKIGKLPEMQLLQMKWLQQVSFFKTLCKAGLLY